MLKRLMRVPHTVRLAAVVLLLVIVGLIAIRMVGAAAAPIVSFVDVDNKPLVGEATSFTIRFDNAGDAVGYGPYVDVILPDYITLGSMTYAGVPVEQFGPITFPTGASPSCVTHPFARDNTGGLKQVCLNSDPGNNVRMYSVKLPFGSYTQDQGNADLNVTVNVAGNAPIGVATTIRAEGGFYLGNDPLDNPTTDPSITSSLITTDVTPTVVKITKTYVDDYLKDEHEIVPGENNSQRFHIVANVANGATVDNLLLSDALQTPLTRVAAETITPGTGTDVSTGQTAAVQWASITGTTSQNDASFYARFEVPYRANGDLVLSSANGYEQSIPNTATVDGVYNSTPLPQESASLIEPLRIKPLITRKDVAGVGVNLNDLVPGNTLEYTIETYLSDYEAIQNLQLSDILPDGETFTPGSATYTVTQDGTTSAAAPITPSSTAGPGPGQTTLGFDLSSLGQLLGGCVPGGGTGGPDPDCDTHNDQRTSVKVVFRASINDAYADTSKVNDGDTLTNTVTVAGDLLDNTNLTPAGANVTDGSSATVNIARRAVSKDLYAVNGSTSLPAQLAPGDVVTYRLQYDVPSTDFPALKIDDYLPLPMFSAGGMSTTFDTTIDANAPPTNTAKFGPTETLYSFNSTTPVVTVESGNVVRFTWPETHDPGNAARHIDILFSVTITDSAYAPGMYVTNQATSTEGDTGSSFSTTDTHQIELKIPEPVISKGVVASNNTAAVFTPSTVGPVAFSAPGTASVRFTSGSITSANLAATPIDSNVHNTDYGDLETFAIVMENTGDGDLFNARLKDSLPQHMSEPGGGYNIFVSDGTGAALAHTNVGGGTGLFDQGIELTNPIPNKNTVTPGANIVVVTFDLQVAQTAEADEVLTNTADLTHFAAEASGVNYMNNQEAYQDTATVTVTNAAINKVISGTNLADTTGNNVVIGEQVTYTATLTVPEGTMSSATIVDTLDTCLAIAYLDDLTASPGITASAGSMAAILSAAQITNVGAGIANEGRRVTLNFGDIVNSNTDNSVSETITFVYRVVPINAAGCARGGGHNNNISAHWDTSKTVSHSAPNVITQEPTTTITKAFVPATGDGDDIVKVRLTVHATSGTNHSNAYNVVATDNLTSTNFTYAGNIQNISGPVPTSSGEASGTVTFTWDKLDVGQTAVVEFDVQVKETVSQGSANNNTGHVAYTSYPGTPDANQDTHNPLACERTGNTSDCGGTANTYASNGNASFTVHNIDEMTKSLVTTSEAFTTGSNVAIGEIVRYRLTARIPEGTNPQTVFRDALQNGLQFLNDDTATAALVSNGNLTSSTMSGPGLNIVGDQTTLGSITPTFSIPASALVGGPFSSGTTVDFDFGTVTNTDNDANSEYIVVEFNALVNNVAGNLRGSVLSNRLTVRQGGSDVGHSPMTDITIQEPVVTVNKSVTTAPVDAGDPVAYSITITNTSGTNLTTGYDWKFQDVLDQYLQYDSVTDLVAPGYATATPSFQFGTTVVVDIDELRPGDSVSFTINATVKDTAPSDYTVPNTGTATTTSLPGPRGTTSNPTGSSTPGDVGEQDGERQLSGNGSANTTLAVPTIAKQPAQEGNTASVGATVTFPITVTVSQGVTLNAVLTDNLPPGLQYLSHTVDTTGFTGSFANDPPIRASPVSSPGSSGEDFVLNFGNISTPGTTGSYSSFKVLVAARVTNELSNQIGHVLTNTASLAYTDPNPPGGTKTVNSSGVDVTIEEPELQLTKTIAGTDPREVGQALNFTVQIENIGDATAYEWSMTDNLAEHTTLTGTPTCTKQGNPLTITQSVTNGVLSITEDPVAGSTLAVGQIIECNYSVTIGETAVVASTYINTADTDWWSGPSSNPQSRHYDDTTPYIVDQNQDTDTAEFTMESATFDKTDGGLTSAVIGQIVPYTITVQIPDGTIDDFSVSDTLPTGMIYVGNGSITGAPTVTPTVVGTNDGSAPVTVTWDFGNITEPKPEQVVITYQVRVANTASNEDGTILTNAADVTFTPEGGAPINLTDQDTFTVREPKLNIDKTADKTQANYGTIVNYTITVSHDGTSTADANNVSVSDTIPAGMSLVQGSVHSGDTAWNITENSNGFTATRAAYASGAGNTVITYQAQVKTPPNAPAIGSSQNNTVSLNWTSLPGANPNGRDGSGGVNDYSNTDDQSVTANAIDLAISKTDGGGEFLPGDTIPYTLQVENLGNVTATGITVTETVPVGTTFNASTSTAGWSCANGAASGTTCNFQIASLAASGSSNVTFAVTVLNYETLPQNIGQIDNTTTVVGDSSNGTEADTTNNSDNDTSPLEISDLAITKGDSIDPVYVTHDYSYEIIVTNNGPDTATDVAVHDTIPEGVSIDNVSTNNPSMNCMTNGQDIDCTMASMTNGQVVAITVDVNGDTPGKKINTATVKADQQDPNRSNNSDTEDTLVDPADIALTKQVDNNRPMVGQTVTFTIGITNNGPDHATGLTVVDTMPDMFVVTEVTPGQGSCSGTTTITCNLGTLNSGDKTNIVIKAKVVKGGTATNTVSSTLNEYDPNPTNSTNIGVEVQASSPLVNAGSPFFTAWVASLLILGTALALFVKGRRPAKS